MAPGTHAFIGWWVANVEPLTRRDRFVLFLAGVLPDLDGLPRLWGDYDLYVTYHHVLCHNLLGCVIWTAVVAAVARRRLVCATLAFLSWHVHLACDYFGSGAGDGSVWVLPYLFPAVGGWAGGEFVGPAWYWNPWQWPLDGWPNFLVTVLGAAMWVYIGVRLDRTWFEFISPWFDGEVCKMLRRWFGGTAVGRWSPAEARWMRRAFLAVTCAAVLACAAAGARAVGSGVRA
jgi:hypothetical protein